ncbi:hypothetical protein SELMODRAFT_426500 [Selaginella moellendorffii]|uniref:Uncharacterized protein n=1 Tax=Selaginella moellendorffii TaxID=88036 RepID=D8SWK0_SELML|nr:hypothetical protein SELMODRAFT_426500 [Selaginella moellendorffii]
MARRPGQVIEFEAHVSGSSDNFISPAKYVRQQGIETSQYKIEGAATALQEWNQQLCVDISDSLCVKKDFYLADLHRYDLMLGLTFNPDVNWKTKEVVTVPWPLDPDKLTGNQARPEAVSDGIPNRSH